MRILDRIARFLGIGRKRRDLFPGLTFHSDGKGRFEVTVKLRVWIYQESKRWIAQGIDLDYVASGATRNEAQRKFSNGLMKTICLYVVETGSLDAFARPAPDTIVHAFNLAMLGEKTNEPPRIRRVEKQEHGRTMRGELAYLAPQGHPQAA